MDRLPPLTAIRAFEAAGRHENFSRAAEELGMTQAAVSYQIRQLEDRVGKPLFVREKGRVNLSDVGRRLLPALTGAFASMTDAFAAVWSEDEDVLSLNASVSIGASWLSERIGRFQLRHPDLAVRMSLSNEVVDLATSPYDAAIRVGYGKWEGLRAEFLFRQHFSPICAPVFLEKNRIEKPEDLLAVERFAPNDRWWAGWFAANGIGTPPPPRTGIVFDNQLQEATAMRQGFGIALMSPLFWRADLEAGRLVQPFDTLYYPGPAQWLIHSESRVGVRKIERLREWLREEIAADRGFLPAEVWEPL
ncbi:LysR family glycine cleavage system transcriptional activator [Novosphingobium sp. PhB165]|uniref:LysR substrate-binding domain-containing protein n=1 Tax=Novosphingobium sp. PhB165 TaxID=2485105 RepID=UPI0010495EE8|nr:LysR substrate-binding domain-containing protein [Novosphingobium sp. PhB165]TCM21585.1 LysR family glycine cleavage system transcriptional activator [Novosphingobium sp. PhB165]